MYEAEMCINYSSVYLAVRGSTMEAVGAMNTPEAIASSAVKTAMDMNAKMLIVLTELVILQDLSQNIVLNNLY